MNGAALTVRGLSASYSKISALGPLDFDVAPGRVVALAGENGSGKSTLLRALAGLLPHRGTVELGGRELAAYPRRGRARMMAYVPQSVELIFPILVEDLVLQGRAPWRSGWMWDSDTDRSAAREAMNACDIEHLAARDAMKISGGERRRAFLARMLAQTARVWLLDEPTADLDPRHRLEFLATLKAAHERERPVILWATHDLDDALAIADDVILLRQGRLAAAGPVPSAVTPENLRSAFGVEAAIERDSAGRPHVFFLPGQSRRIG